MATKKVIKNVSLEQAQEAGRHYATCTVELSKLEAEMNEDINRVKNRYKDNITELQLAGKTHAAILEVFASEQKGNWGKRKSFDLLHCVVAFRTNPPKVSKSKKFTWDAVTELLKKNGAFSRFLRTTTEINKEAILAEQNPAIIGMLKEDCFINIEQEETFSIDVKKEEITV